MAYTKRWELIHLLGGKCIDCGEDNFYSLEIDHIHNDGDGERKYYTLTEKNYLANPTKAKERLAVRCKTCHEKKHHQPTAYESSLVFRMKKNKMKLLIFKELQMFEGDNKTPVKISVFENYIIKSGLMSRLTTTNYLTKMLREASIYESSPGYYNSVGGEILND